eukprot:15446905-Alexandrium_andersonii.AAC.1
MQTHSAEQCPWHGHANLGQTHTHTHLDEGNASSDATRMEAERNSVAEGCNLDVLPMRALLDGLSTPHQVRHPGKFRDELRRICMALHPATDCIDLSGPERRHMNTKLAYEPAIGKCVRWQRLYWDKGLE